MVVPSGPGLATIHRDKPYYNAIVKSDFALPDSGLLILLLKYTKGIRLPKLSGLTFLRHFLGEEVLRSRRCLFLVDPDETEMMLNHALLCSRGIRIEHADHYVAPIYGPGRVKDPLLLQILENRHPEYILINLGGGIQEKLGLYLKTNLSYRPGIICTGAAIAFLTRRQAAIPALFDALYLGWFLRCVHSPGSFIPRYFKALSLIPLVLREVRRVPRWEDL
jgi:UDP-N-acetyl-D-mannosaminuronic acid transferase (WecB/TagA/CpsF family)